MAGEKNNADKTSSVGARLAALLISAVFALGFGLGGYHAGLKPLARTLDTALQVRGWQPVQAEVLSAELKTHHSSDGATYEVQARYRYQVAGKAYEGTRASRGNALPRGFTKVDRVEVTA